MYFVSPNSMVTDLPQLLSPQRNVPVLGADIIAQTFAGTINKWNCIL